MKRITVIAGLGVSVLLALPTSAAAAVSCEYQEAGPAGAAGNVLAIEASDLEELAAIQRSGSEILVSNDVTGQLLSCAGGTPTVTNLDTITFTGKKESDGLFINLAAGPFGPGATSEGPGSEIEFDFKWKHGQLGVGGTSGNDTFAFGVVPAGGVKTEAALNLNQSDELAKDVDATLDDVDSIIVRLRKGDDIHRPWRGRVCGAPRSRFGLGDRRRRQRRDHRAARRATSSPATRGRNLLRGDSAHDELNGGPGRDTLVGGASGDLLTGAAGLDLVRAGAGNDRLALRDRRRDPGVVRPGHRPWQGRSRRPAEGMRAGEPRLHFPLLHHGGRGAARRARDGVGCRYLRRRGHRRRLRSLHPGALRARRSSRA